MYKPNRENPSFSSSLLDEIYRSIDERPEQEPIVYSTRERKQSGFSGSNGYSRNECDVRRQVSSHGRESRDHCLIEKWMVQDVRSGVDFKRSSQRSVNSSSSSSDSSSGGGFSSSEAESVYCVPSRPKPIRTGVNRHDEYNTRAKPKPKPKHENVCDEGYEFDDLQMKQKHEGKFVKTKSRAMKIYGDLKKVKQPISPGGRLAAFLNSIFTTGNTKNTKLTSSTGGSYNDGRSTHTDRQSKSAGVSTCSSASSFSRSCLSKTPSSRGKSSNSKKRSVRFFPVSVIVGDDCQPCGQKSLYETESTLHALKFVKNPINDEFKHHSSEKSRRIEEAARNLLRNYQKKVECEFELITNNVKVENEIDLNYEDDEEDDDGAGSHTSSDLFELENFSAIGMADYGDELPVYETTHLDTNLGIGNGFR